MESASTSTAMPDASDLTPAEPGAATPEPRRQFLRGHALPVQDLREAVEGRIITADDEIPESSYQPASLDLRLGEVAYRLRCSFLPGGERVEDALRAYAMDRLDLSKGAVLDTNRPYLIPLQEQIHLPESMYARANPRSSTGRLDIFTRLVTDRSEQFDDVRHGYRGRLYVEVVPRSFAVKATAGQSLSQLRLMTGAPGLSDYDVLDVHRTTPILFEDRDAVAGDELRVREGLFLSVDLSGKAIPGQLVGYRARKNGPLLDLGATAAYEPEDYWEPIYADRRQRLVLETEAFYLLYSRERVRIPRDLAADMAAVDPSAGELRTHYAGFFDPGFGDREKAPGTHAVLEVRAHDVPFAIAHGQRICKLAFQKLREPSAAPYGAGIGSRYNESPLILLPRQFKTPDDGGQARLMPEAR